MSEKWVVVFGGAGFLGSHLCESLVNNQKRVICIDNLYTGNLQNIDSLKNNKNFKYINHDIIEKWTLYGTFIEDASFGDLDFSDSQPVEIALTLSYDYAILEF